MALTSLTCTVENKNSIRAVAEGDNQGQIHIDLYKDGALIEDDPSPSISSRTRVFTSLDYNTTYGISAWQRAIGGQIYELNDAVTTGTNYHHTITFINYGTGYTGHDIDQDSSTEYITVIMPHPGTKEGKTFKYWKISWSASTWQPNESVDFKSGTYVVEAHWEDLPYKCTFIYDSNGGSPTPSTETLYYSTVTIPSYTLKSAPTKTDYDFKGWQTIDAGGGIHTYEAEKTYNNEFEASETGTTYTFIAKWEQKSHGCEVWIYINDTWKKATPYIYVNDTLKWQKADTYIYVNGWKPSS